ncbi:DUF3732 domain-containing protein [Shewanella livingstonensis]|uniref:DUF3732 domain-containing protein n=1 Tax=Shewanella livingstonensis TaxID=150120 RepID=A0A3G8LRP5_9GAMM|nr:DUF3732 domain-containing protein [Shewanella livingstonensis]AZG72219.1 DUF3732 domain-containing protein [Shewanella livingstonensis]
MKAVIKKVIIFNSSGDMRFVDFKRGVNVITGDSKTGKSAILEIVDYCLFSGVSSIPAGVITEFAELFCVIYEVDGNYIVVGRHARKTGKGKAAYVKIETNDLFLDEFSCDYFSSIQPVLLKVAQSRFEKFIGLAVSDISYSVNNRKEGKASIRSASSILFQHQNLIANKHALFHRFESYDKRDRTIKEFPIFMGWVDGEYYSSLRELEELEKKIKVEQKLREKSTKSESEKKETVKNLVESYFSYINYQYDCDLPLRKLKALAQELPMLQEVSYSSNGVWRKYEELNDSITNDRAILSDVEKRLVLLESNGDQAYSYMNSLNNIQSTLAVNNISDTKDITCPVCESQLPHMNEQLYSINEARAGLFNKIQQIGHYTEDRSEQVTALESQKSKVQRQIRINRAKLKELEISQKEVAQKIRFRDSAMTMRGKTMSQVAEFFNRDNLISSDTNLSESRQRAIKLREKINLYGLQEKYNAANRFLSKSMTDICDELDFEDELRPVTLHFDLESFSFHVESRKQKIRLYEMGSGANWLACHLSLFLSLLHLTAKEENSCIPSILFIDQPSQVYFPSGRIQKDDKDLMEVANIFDVINKKLEDIKLSTDEQPQVIIMEHADNLSLENGIIFEDLVVERWTESTGDKLI